MHSILESLTMYIQNAADSVQNRDSGMETPLADQKYQPGIPYLEHMQLWARDSR